MPQPAWLKTSRLLKVNFTFATTSVVVHEEAHRTMNTTVAVSSSLTRPPVVLRALIANNSLNTQVSKRLAKKLGLMGSARSVYVGEMLSQAWIDKWKISVQPVVLTVEGLAPVVLFPLINCSESDAWWEMIIGRDCAAQNDLMRVAAEAGRIERSKKQRRGLDSDDDDPTASLFKADDPDRATPGPAFKLGTIFMGHNVRIIDVGDFIQGAAPDEFFEFLCFDSEAIHRLAVNRASRQVAVIYHDSKSVYLYREVSQPLLAALAADESKGRAVAAVKAACDVTTIHEFPQAALTNLPIKHVPNFFSSH